MNFDKVCAVILAAGNGRRMQSGKIKIFCEVLFKPIISWVFQNCEEAQIKNTCLVCSEDTIDKLKEFFGNKVNYCIQKEKLGTAHAVQQATNFLRNSSCEDVLILLGDVPFIDKNIINSSYDLHKQKNNEATVIAATLKKPFGYGRIDEIKGKVEIVEECDATDRQRAIKRVNSGAMWFNIEALLDVLDKVGNNNANKEYYITTAVNILKRTSCYVAKDSQIILGANTNEQLLKLNEIAKSRIIKKLSNSGVEFITNDGVIISTDAVIEKGTLIFPNVTIKGKCHIGANCTITSGSFIEESQIGTNCIIKSSYILNSCIGNNVRVGPFSHLRPDNKIYDAAKIGNFVEIKNSNIGEATSIAHLTYIGDGDIGSKVNFGCGCTTANYDGRKKHRTKIGNNAFIGCDTSLIAPIEIGNGAFIAAGSTITESIQADDFAIARAKQVTKPKYMIKRRDENKQL